MTGSTSRPTLFITRRWPPAAEEVAAAHFDLTLNQGDQALTAGGLTEAMSTFDAIAPTVTDRIDDAVLAAEPRQTQILANYGAGVSHIDLTVARERGVTVTNTPDVLTDATADLTMTLLLMTARRAGEGERHLRAGAWSGWRPTHHLGTEVTGKTLGLIGMGRIGRAVTRRAVDGFGMRVVYFNRSRIDPPTGATPATSIDEVLGLSDFVSLHVPGGESNRHLIDARRLTLMKPHAHLVNTARGEIVDEAALAEALARGRLAGAGLDVYEEEPQVHPGLLALENVVLLPHLGSATAETRLAMGLRVIDNLRAFFDGQSPPDRMT